MTRPQRWIVEGIAGVFVLAVTVAVLYPAFIGSAPSSPTTHAMSNLKQVAVGHLIYHADWDDRYAHAATWAETLFPYTKNQKIFRVRESKPDEFAVAFMKRLGGTKINEKESERQALVFETTDPKWNAAHNFTQVWWHRDRKTAVAFADSHAKAFRYYDPGVPAEGTGLAR